MFPWEESYEQPAPSDGYRISPTTGQLIPHIMIGGKKEAEQPPTSLSDVPGATTAVDVLQSIKTGIATGLIGLADIPNLIERGIKAGNSYLVDKGLAAPIENSILGKKVTSAFDAPVSPDIQKSIESVTGEFYKPQTTAGEYAKTIGEFAPGMVAGPGGWLRNTALAVPRAVTPGVFSETAGRVAKEYAPKYETAAKIGGAVLGGWLGARRVTPTTSTPERRQLAAVLDAERVPITAGQRTGNKPLQWLESTAADTPIAARRAAELNERTGRAFTSAALRRMGYHGDELATPAVLARESGRIGNVFETIGARSTLRPDPRFHADLTQARTTYNRLVSPNARTPAVEHELQDIVSIIRQNGGNIPGDVYNTTRSRLTKEAHSLRATDPQTAEALSRIRDALDAAMGRSIPAADRAAWREAQRQWANWKIIEKATSGAGTGTAEGFISPDALRAAVAARDKGAYVRGWGDMADLARAGQILRPLPSSGTAQRSAANSLYATVPAMFAGQQAGGWLGALAGASVPWVGGRALLSAPAQRYLGNQLTPSTREDRLLNAIMSLYTGQNLSMPVP